jgi:ATPase subunit of ABC transporter with duplicated ATPase domains
MALFGENGAGKSTLMKIINNDISDYDGEVLKTGHVRVFYVHQEFQEKNYQKTILEFIKELGNNSIINKVFSNGNDLGYDLESNCNKKCNELSGGQQKILHLSVALATNPDYLLLDEPENHLDIVSRKVLIEKLQEFDGGIIFISHDRFLIDSLATKVGELYNGVLHLSEGGYDKYLETKNIRVESIQRKYKTEEKRIKQLEKTHNILKKSAHRGRNIPLFRRIEAELFELKEKHSSGQYHENVDKIKINIEKEGLHSGKLLVRFSNASFSYGDINIFKNTNVEFRSGNKIALLGRNGSGKSTFLKCLIGELNITNGKRVVGENIKISYFDQHSSFEKGVTALDIVSNKLDLTNDVAKKHLGQYRFDFDRMLQKIENLSGGEKMRVRLALSFGLKPDLLVLDEPTNHIDEVTWEVLLDAIKNFQGSILLVSHDYEFIQEFEPDLFWMFQKKEVVERYKTLDELLGELDVT